MLVESKKGFERLGSVSNKQLKVCYNWRNGNCSRFPCPYLHTEFPESDGISSSNRPDGFRHGSNFKNSWVRREQPQPKHKGSGNRGVVRNTEKVCKYWLDGICNYGEKCKFLHSWYKSDSFSLLSQLEGHEKVVMGIVLPSGSDKLYTGSKDGTVRVWDCNSGQCAGVFDLDTDIGCMLNEGPWIFVGSKNQVRAWNSQTSTNLSLEGPAGQVFALVVGNDMLFAGAEDGAVLAWKFDVAINRFEPAASLNGHTRAVVTLVVGANRLYSGSMDHSIRVWSLDSLQCVHTLTDHTDVVMSVLCWDQFLLSCSLDKTVKVWAGTESGNLEVIYTHKEEHGLLTLCGVHDAAKKPVLLCSCNDNSVHVFDLPSFVERGKIFSKTEVRAIQNGPGIFFTGDGAGPVRVWKWEG